MYIKISFQDNRNWTTIEGRVIDWSNPSSKIKPERVVPTYIAPEITTDTWNGIEKDIQHITWDSYTFSFFLKEAENFDLVKMKSCDNIAITQYVTIDNTNKTKVYDVDTRKGDYFEISEPEQVDNTTSFKTTVTFRTQRAIINKADPILNTNSIDLGEGGSNFTETVSTDVSLSGMAICNLDNDFSDFNPIVGYKDGVLRYYHQVGNVSDYIQVGSSLNITGYGSAKLAQCFKKYNGWPTFNILGDGNGKLARFYFNGSDFGQVGNSLEIGSGVVPNIASFHQADIDNVLISTTQTNVTFDSYIFDGIDWSLDATIPTYTPSEPCDNVSISSYFVNIESNSFFAFAREIQSDTNIITSSSIRYSNSSGWSELSTEFKVSGGGNLSVLGSGINRFYLVDETSGLVRYLSDNIYSYDLTTITNPSFAGGGLNTFATLTTSDTNSIKKFAFAATDITYYTDFDLVLFEDDESNITIPWNDGVEKTIKTTSSSGVRFLHYLSNELATLFSNQLRAANPPYINGIEVLRYDLDVTDAAEDYYKVIVNAVTDENITEYDISPNQTNKIEFDANVYYSDYNVFDYDSEPSNIEIEWSDDSVRDIQTISKTGLKFTTFISSNDINTFVNQLKAASITEINDVAITEVEYSIQDLGSGWNQVEVTGITNIISTNFDVSPLNTNKIEFDLNVFYSDYDVFDYDTNTQDVLIDWSDGSQRKLQSIDKSGLKFTTFLESDEINDFISKLKAASVIEINDTAITEVSYSISEVNNTWNQIEVTGVTTQVNTDFDISPLNTNKLEFYNGLVVTNTYNTDYEILETDRNTESIFVDWPDGTRKLAQTNDKPTITFTTWLDNADLSTFITELKAATSVEINDVVVNEYEYSFEDVGFNYNKVVVTGITSTTVTNFDLTPNNTYNLELTVNAVVTNYYTDYPVELTSLPPVLTTFNNTGGIDVRTRSISKNAKKMTLFLDETNTFALKEDFELGTAKLDTVVVKENESIVIEKIGVDLYRVEVDLIMDTTKIY